MWTIGRTICVGISSLLLSSLIYAGDESTAAPPHPVETEVMAPYVIPAEPSLVHPLMDHPAGFGHYEPVPVHTHAHAPVDWSKVPPIEKIPRAGWFTISDGGPGYYSFYDWRHGIESPKAPPAPFGTTGSDQTPFYDYDFRYLDDPLNTYHMWSDAYKRVILKDEFLFTTGGEFRLRYNDYTNYQLSGENSETNFTRLRLYGDLSYRDLARVYLEFIDARSVDDKREMVISNESGTDLLNVFTEWKLGEIASDPLQFRVGRQEIVMGSQRLIASPDFSNTLRTYDGVRGYWYSSMWNVDLFWVRPVSPNRDKMDAMDQNRALSGLWVTRHPTKEMLVDLYLLNLTDTRVGSVGNTVTLGTRIAGDMQKRLLYDFELMAQTGERNGRTINAHAVTSGLGWQFAFPWDLSFWTYYDYASGTKEPESNKYETFNQLFPAGHTYFGYLDIVGRQNIHDLNFQLQFYPQKWLQLRMQYHIFHLASATDALYNARGQAIRQDITGAAGKDVGKEIDLLGNIHLTPHQNFLFGYSQLFAGRFVKQTGSAKVPSYTYAQYSIRW